MPCRLFRVQIIIWTDTGALSIGPTGQIRNIYIDMQQFSYKKIDLNMSSAK